jgi:hypothetical protein
VQPTSIGPDGSHDILRPEIIRPRCLLDCCNSIPTVTAPCQKAPSCDLGRAQHDRPIPTPCLFPLPLSANSWMNLTDYASPGGPTGPPSRPGLRGTVRVSTPTTPISSLYCRLCSQRSVRIASTIGRGLSLGASRKLELARYREPGSGVDLADCVERILSVTVSARDDLRGPSGGKFRLTVA